MSRAKTTGAGIPVGPCSEVSATLICHCDLVFLLSAHIVVVEFSPADKAIRNSSLWIDLNVNFLNSPTKLGTVVLLVLTNIWNAESNNTRSQVTANERAISSPGPRSGPSGRPGRWLRSQAGQRLLGPRPVMRIRNSSFKNNLCHET